MSLMIATVYMREHGHQSPRIQLNQIDFSSRFSTMKWFNSIDNPTDEQILRVAREMRDGWKQCGPWPNAVFEITTRSRYSSEEEVLVS